MEVGRAASFLKLVADPRTNQYPRAKKIVREILNNPNSSIKERLTGRFRTRFLKFVHLDNRGLRFSTNGEFIGFLEP